MSASLALTELLVSAIQQLPALLCTGDSGELWGLPPVLGITAASWMGVLRNHFLEMVFPLRLDYQLKIKE